PRTGREGAAGAKDRGTRPPAASPLGGDEPGGPPDAPRSGTVHLVAPHHTELALARVLGAHLADLLEVRARDHLQRGALALHGAQFAAGEGRREGFRG